MAGCPKCRLYGHPAQFDRTARKFQALLDPTYLEAMAAAQASVDAAAKLAMKFDLPGDVRVAADRGWCGAALRAPGTHHKKRLDEVDTDPRRRGTLTFPLELAPGLPVQYWTTDRKHETCRQSELALKQDVYAQIHGVAGFWGLHRLLGLEKGRPILIAPDPLVAMRWAMQAETARPKDDFPVVGNGVAQVFRSNQGDAIPRLFRIPRLSTFSAFGPDRRLIVWDTRLTLTALFTAISLDADICCGITADAPMSADELEGVLSHTAKPWLSVFRELTGDRTKSWIVGMVIGLIRMGISHARISPLLPRDVNDAIETATGNPDGGRVVVLDNHNPCLRTFVQSGPHGWVVTRPGGRDVLAGSAVRLVSVHAGNDVAEWEVCCDGKWVRVSSSWRDFTDDTDAWYVSVVAAAGGRPYIPPLSSADIRRVVLGVSVDPTWYEVSSMHPNRYRPDLKPISGLPGGGRNGRSV